MRDFAEEVGYPLILKPHDAAGAAGTYRVENDEELEEAIVPRAWIAGMPTAVEEFVEGHEAFYDTLTADGEVVHDFISHYYPNVLEAMRTRWISPQIITTNRLDAEAYEEVKELGKRVIDVLGIETSATHMEWFFGPRACSFSEIACRPPGVGVWDLYGPANDLDLYVEWAKLITRGKTEPARHANTPAGMIALRPDKDGTITGYEGSRRVERDYAPHILDMHIPPPGARTQGVEGGYMANAYIRMRHPDYDELRRIMNHVGETVRVLAR